MLLIPAVVTLDPAAIDRLVAAAELLEPLGFVVEALVGMLSSCARCLPLWPMSIRRSSRGETADTLAEWGGSEGLEASSISF